MPIPSAFVTRFFQLVTKRRFAEAERMLERLEQRIQKTEWNSGYFQALHGIFLAKKSNNDRYAFLSNNDFNNPDELKNYRREFLKHTRNKLHADYDRGFFSAWANYMRILTKLEKPMEVKTMKSVKSKQQTKKKPQEASKIKPKQIESETSAKLKRIVQTKLV
ncbi:hypothetical protein E3J74_03930 [Candidatus Bathyarchaeota archaeon]|nr:MAG: hypothetical protein E3J74_03930 [Candidatus Bathyarchaeota archaeon]